MVNRRGRPVNRKATNAVPNVSFAEVDEPEEIIEDRSRSGFGNISEERTAREIDSRKRSEVEDDEFAHLMGFDYNNFDTRKLQLTAPKPRIDEKHGQMVQKWVAHKLNNGSMFLRAKESGYRIRNPNTIPGGFTGHTEKWEMRDSIVVGGDMILMEMPKYHFDKISRAFHQSNNTQMLDIQNSHGDMKRPEGGDVKILKDRNASRFYSATEVPREQEGGNISFDD